MATMLAETPELAIAFNYVTPWLFNMLDPRDLVVIPTGALRIGGDSPNGLVLVSSAPAARPVWVLDMATGVLVAQTTSASDGTYNVPGLSARTDGYLVWIRGTNAGERDYCIPGVHPG